MLGLTDLCVVVQQQVVGALVSGAVVGARPAVPLHHHSFVGRRGAALPADLHHRAHVPLSFILVPPLPVQAAHNTHAHLHAATRWLPAVALAVLAVCSGAGGGCWGSRRRERKGLWRQIRGDCKHTQGQRRSVLCSIMTSLTQDYFGL